MVNTNPCRTKTLSGERNRYHRVPTLKRLRELRAELSALKLVINGLADELDVQWDGSIAAAERMYMRVRTAIEN